MSNTITCPKCNAQIEITEVMSAQLAARIRGELEAELLPRKQALEQQAIELQKQAADVEAARIGLDEQVQLRLAAERTKIAEQARAKAAEDVAVELRDRDEQLNELRAKLKGAEEQELTWRRRERELKDREDSLTREREEMAQRFNEQFAAERQKLIDEVKKNAAEQYATELNDRDRQIQEYQERIKAAREAELELRKRERALEQRAEELELDTERKLAGERDEIREAAFKKAAEEHGLKDAEKDKKIADLIRQLDEMKRKAEQGSQQTQGEVLELALADLLRETFPSDGIEDVPKGIKGGDVVQRVISSAGVDCGTILWETKRTKSWSDGWLAKLRQDQRQAKAVLAILVTTALPVGVDNFAEIKGIWVSNWACAVHVAAALRLGLLESAKARRALVGQHGKMEAVYKYLASAEFRNRVAGIVEAFATMKADLDSEKRAVQKHWARREKQIDQAIGCTAGMYGDLQGIIGASLPEIDGMDLSRLEVMNPPALTSRPDTE